MSLQTSRTMQEYRTSASGDEVLRAAKEFFSSRNSIYASFLDREGPTFVSLRGQGGEEVVIGVAQLEEGGGTLVTGSTYLFDMQVARFFSTLPPVSTEPEPVL